MNRAPRKEEYKKQGYPSAESYIHDRKVLMNKSDCKIAFKAMTGKLPTIEEMDRMSPDPYF